MGVKGRSGAVKAVISFVLPVVVAQSSDVPWKR